MASLNNGFCMTVDCFSMVFSYLPERDLIKMQNICKHYYTRILPRLFLRMPNPACRTLPIAITVTKSDKNSKT